MFVFEYLSNSLRRAMGKNRRQPAKKRKPTKFVRLEIEALERRDVPTSGPTLGGGGAGSVPAAGLVAAYNFNQGSGAELTDISGNGNNGAIANAAWSTTAHSGDSHSLYFNGTSAIINIPNSASLQLTTGMTLEAWVDPTAVTATWGDVISMGSSPDYYLGAYSPHNDEPAAEATFGSSNTATMYGTSALAANTWTFLALTYNGSSLQLYVNGALVSSVAETGNIVTSTTGELQIGGGAFGNYFTGYIDDVRVYNTGVPAAQIRTDMSTPVTAALVVSAGASKSGNEASAISFAGTASGGSGALAYSWNFGDGSAAATGTLDPSHTYAIYGTYTVTLTVSDAVGDTTTSTTTVTVKDVAPTVSEGGPYAGVAGSPIAFAASATDPSAQEVAAGFSYSWSFGDGSTSTLQNPSHTYASSGSHTVTLVVKDEDGVSTTAATSVTVAAVLTASAGPSETGNEGSSILFAGTASGGSGTRTYSWNFGDGSAAVTGSLTPNHVYAIYGTYTATLTVTDGLGDKKTSTTTVTVKDVAPTVSIGGPYPGVAGSAIAFKGSATDPSAQEEAAGFSYSWSFDDGSTSTLQNPSHTYVSAGSYIVKLTVTDEDGVSTTATTTATVAAALAASAGPSKSGNEGSAVSFAGTASGGSGTRTYSWNFGDGSAAITGTLTPSHTFAIYGTYTVTLAVTDAIGDKVTSTTTVTVKDVAPTVSSGGSYSGVAGAAIAFKGSATDPSAQEEAAGFSYSWTFGDASTSTLQDPSHIYASAGTYTVTLTVTDKDGVSTTATTRATIAAPPALVVSAGPNESGNEGSAISFVGTASGGSGVLSYSWSFGDGSAAITGTRTPSHTYAIYGTYTVTLTVTDSAGQMVQSSTKVTVNDVAPTVSSGGPYSGAAGSAVAFTASATDPSSQEMAAGFSYSWAFGDGSTSTLQNPSHSYASAGSYTVTLTVTDEDGLKSAATTTAAVAAGPLVVSAGAAESGNEESAISFAGTASGGSGALTYSWNFGDGGPVTTGTLTPTHTYAIFGTYTATLTVTDSAGHSAQSSTTVTVNDVAPSVTIGDPTGIVGTPIPFTASATDPSPVEMAAGFTYVWDFGDGSTSTLQDPSHAFANPGTYTVTVTATDEDGMSNSASTTVTIAPALVASAGPGESGNEDSAISFAGSASGGIGALSYSWSFGDGTPAVTGTPTPSHGYDIYGTYTATLTVTDSAGDTAQSSTTVTVSDVAPAAAIGGPYAGVAGSGIAFTASATDPSTQEAAAGFSYSWSFGDGSTSALQNPTYSYTNVGTYTVTLTVTDEDGVSTTAATTATVAAAAQTITVTTPASPIAVGATDVLSATGGDSGNPVTFSIDPSSTGSGTINGNVLTATGAGNIIIDYNQAGGGNYSAASQVQQTLVVSAASQTINFTAPASPISFVSGEQIALSATGGASGNAVVFTIDSSSTGTGTINGSTLTVTGAGNIVIDANQPGNSNYSAAPEVQQTLVVNMASQTIAFTAPASPISFVPGQQIALTASGGASGDAVIFSIDASSTGAGTISGSTLTVTGAGSIVIDANQGGNSNYSAAAQVQQTLMVSKASQTINFTASASPVTYSGQQISLSATATSGLGVVFTIDASSTGTGTISGSTLTVTGAGNIVIDANQAGNSNYGAATQVQQTLAISKASQAINFTAPVPISFVSGQQIALSATGGASGNAVAFTIDAGSTGTGTINGSTLTVTGAGNIVIDANQAGNSNYNAATQVQQTLAVSKASQAISFTAPVPISFVSGEQIALSATGGASGNAVAFTIDSSSTGTGTINGSTLTVTGAGNIVIDANQAGNSNYNAATQVQQTLVVSNANQTITFTAPTSPVTYSGQQIGLSATATSGLAVVFTIDASSTGTGTISGSTLTVTGAGNIVIDANQAGNGNYSAAAQVQQTLVVSKASQTINFTAPAPISFVSGQQVALSATGGASGNTVAFTIDSSSTGTGTINGSTLTVTGAGNIVIDASQAGNTNYSAAAQVQQTLAVSKASQTINFTAPASPVTYSGQQINLSASATSGLAVVFTIDSSSTGTGTISGSTLTVTGAGNIVIDANQTGNSNYSAAAQVQKTLVVSKASQTISFTAPTSPVTYSGQQISLSATSTSGLAVVFTIDASSTGTGTISGSTLTVTGAGNIVIDANQAGNSNYGTAAQVQQTLAVSKAGQTISFTAPAPVSFVSGQQIALSATGGASGNAVAFTIDSSSTGTGTISGSTLTVTGAGNIEIDANQAGNSNYSAAAQVQQTLAVSKAGQTITFTAPASPVTYSGQQISLSASATSGLAVVFTIDASSTGTGTINGSTLTVTGAGNIVLDANQAGNSNYSAANQVQKTLVVSKASQTITFTAPASPVTYSGQQISLSASATSGLAVVFTIDASSTGTGTINGSTLTVTGAGNIVLDANQAGNSNYSAANQVQKTLAVSKASQTITFTAPASPVTYSGQQISLSASATSGLAVVFTIDASSTGTGTINGSTLTVTGAGNIVLDANQAGNSNYSAATQVQQTLVVSKASQTISFTAPASPVTYSGQQISLSATATSGLTVVFTIDASSTGTGTISGSTLNVTGPGNIVLDANQAGNGNYSAATQVQKTLVVNKVSQTITFTAPASPISYVSGQQINLSATGGASGNAVVFTIDASSTGTGTISGSTLTVTGAGNIVIDANQAGNSIYSAAAQVQQTLVVNSGQATANIVTNYLTIPNFGANPTITSVASGNWSNPATWSLDRVPTTGDIVDIMAGTTVTYDVNDSTDSNVLNTVEVQANATLTFSTTVNTQMCVINFMVLQGGTLNIGTQANPIPSNITAQVVFANVALNTTIDPAQYGNGLIVLGNFSSYGAAKSSYVTLAQEADAGATTLTLASPEAGWQVGDSLQLPDTRQLDYGGDYSSYTPEWETVTIQSISTNGETVTLTAPLAYSHLGGYDANGVLDYLPQVVDMTRNVKIHSQSATGTRGYALFTGYANVSMYYTSFTGMGRTTDDPIDNTTFNASGTATYIGTNEANRNAITFLDLIGPSSPQADGYQYTFVGNVVTCPLTPMPFIWGINVSNSFYGLIQNNDVVNWNGAGIAVDGTSSYNNFTGNLVMRITGTSSRPDQALQGDAFWFGNPNNYVTNNIATDINGGGYTVYSYGFDIDVTGGMYGGSSTGGDTSALVPAHQGDDPSVAGQSVTLNMNDVPILDFSGNEVYGATSSGMTVWWIGTLGDTFYTDAQNSVVQNLLVWNIGTRAFYGYPTNNLIINGLIVRGSPSYMDNSYNYSQGVNFDDYMTRNLIIENSNIQGMYTGIEAPFMVGRVSAMDTTLIENCYLDNIVNIDLTPARSVNGDSDLSPQTMDIANDQFASPAGTPASWCFNISMSLVTSDSLGTSDMTVAQYVYVTNYNDIAGDNFQVFYDQGPSPTDSPAGSGIFRSGLTSMTLIYGYVYIGG